MVLGKGEDGVVSSEEKHSHLVSGARRRAHEAMPVMSIGADRFVDFFGLFWFW